MGILHQFLQSFIQHVCVDLRGGDIRMAEKLLDDAQIRAVVQEVRGEGMAEDVGGYFGRIEPGGNR